MSIRLASLATVTALVGGAGAYATGGLGMITTIITTTPSRVGTG